MQSTLDLIKPQAKFDIVRDWKMENQYNTKHGAKHRIFNPQDKVYVRDFRNRKVIWSPATIIGRVGSVVYNVECDNLVWRRHANQIRPRYIDENGHSDQTLSLLFDVFDIPPTIVQQVEPSNENTSSSAQIVDEPLQVPVQEPIAPTLVRAYPQRNRRPPVRTNFSSSVNGRYEDA